ncbi:MAG: phenylalanine--tRNA ligase subunit alpha, partial [Candidatus Magasanikbacteria bacterium]|nr:phenylalanine--tRNA ligase subunit alpha [Candidatus Magasanikbacteria bacterium]
MYMQDKLQQLKKQALSALEGVKNKLQLEEWENKFLGRKSGELTDLMKGLKDLSDDVKRVVGQVANEVKQALEQAVTAKRQELALADFKNSVEQEKVDISQPSLIESNLGHFHPNTIVQKKLEELFSSMGFLILDGPDLESDYYNFEALNVPASHPARDMQDTFYIKDHSNWVLRTHTSPVQVRALQKYGAPLRAVVPGRCFRNESTDAAHEHTFYQLEGLVVDKNISISNLIGVMKELLKGVLGREVEVRLRPGFF